MEAKELRIGNLVTKGGEVFEADFITINMAHNYHPIPLTPEILEAAGFKKQDETSDWSLGYLYITNSEFVLLSRNNSFYYIDAINKEVTHLHQLQNLYYALTGQELAVNLQKETAL